MFHLKLLLSFSFFLFTSFCFAQNERESRDEFTLKIAIDSIQYYKQVVPKSKYFVDEGVLQIFPGEKLLIEAEIDGKMISSMKVVNENINPSRTIEIEFNQTTEGLKHKYMVLEVRNPFDKELNYDAKMFIVGHDKWLDTSILTILPNLTGYEMWNDIIITLDLSNWRIGN